MNSRLNQKAWQAGRFIDFLLHSGNRHRIHSPFLYSLIDEVIRSDKPVIGMENIEKIRQECLLSREIIQKTDFGKGAHYHGDIKYRIPVKQLAATSLTPGRFARRLNRLVRFMKSERILEIGTSLGITTSYLAIANPKARVVTLEGCPELSRKAREHFTRLGLDNTELIEGRFEDTLDGALQKLGGVDLVFIDGNHQKEAMLEYFKKCLAFSNNNTVMVFDDIHHSIEMEQAWEEIRRHRQVRVSLDLFFSGWIFFREESSREHFKLRYI